MQLSNASYYFDQFELPPELCTKPLALVGMSGLDTLNNAVHKSVWEMFSSSRRQERAPVAFRLIGNAHEFPVVKPKRNSYDWYHPKGILKRNWMNKHLNEIPAVIVIFYDLDWNDPHWNEKMIECASRVQSMRAALDGRNTRITIVLLQTNVSLPAGEDVLASERAVALCASCELNAKSLFILPHSDHLQGYIVRLENAFYDLAQNYYHLEAKTIKSHRDHLNKTTHQYLFVRHQFKMGFLYELKQDIHTAHKHYTHAYNNLLEIRIVDTNALEIRTVAGFINYKLCKLMFALNLPRDAISQFKAHTEQFKSRIGFQELAFEHYGWLSKQFTVFGDIFDEAVKLGLPAVQTQHPGIYYQQAAQYAIMRKNACYQLCSEVQGYPTPDPLEGSQYIDFYGQLPWRPVKLTAEPSDPQMEINGLRALQYLEKQFNHSALIISLYGQAISQYKIYRCPRTRRFLVLQMADEYYNSKDYGKCLTLLTHMLSDFRCEKWWSLLTDILLKAIRCAYLVANIQDYISLSLEILGNSVLADVEMKKKIYYNLHRLLKKQMPDADSVLTKEDIETATKLWESVLSVQHLNVSLDMCNITSCIDCKVRFLQSKYEVDQSVFVELYIRNSALYPLMFLRLSVTVNTPKYSSEFAVSSGELQNPSLEFKSKEMKRFLIEFMPDSNDIDKEIQIGYVNLLLGREDNCMINLKFANVGTESQVINPELLHFKYVKDSAINFDNIQPQSSALIVPRCSKLNLVIEHNQPALAGEWYEIKLIIENKEAFIIKDMKIEVNGFMDNFEIANGTLEVVNKLPMLVTINSLELNEAQHLNFYVRALSAGEYNVTVRISYMVELEAKKTVTSVKEEMFSIPTVKALDMDTKYLSVLLEDIQKCYVDEEFSVMPVIKCISPWPIIIENTKIKFIPPVFSIDNNTESQIKNMQLQANETCAEMYVAKLLKQGDSAANFGVYSITWKRVNGQSALTEIPILSLPVDWIPLDIKIGLPPYALVRTPLFVTYTFYNRSHHLIQLDVNMEGSEAFMFAGYKQVSILPEDMKVLKYTLYPLVTGSIALPKLVLTVPENSTEGPALRQEQLKLLVGRSLPTHLFVMPQVKGNSSKSIDLNLETIVVTKK